MLKIFQRSVAKSKGFAYEQFAASYLQQQGLTILVRNYNCLLGEIDLIAVDEQHLIFIEVKARRNQKMMSIRETIGYAKQQKLIRTAQHFLINNQQYINWPMRFDFVGIETDSNRVDWLHNAFSIDS